MSASRPQLVTLILLLTFLCANFGAGEAQDLRGGASVVFVQHPRNPLVRPRTEHSNSQRSGHSTPGSGRTNANEAAKTSESTDAVEDALSLGNSARETKPPRYRDSEKAYKLAAKLNPKDPRPYIGLANIWYDQQHYEEAAQMYRRAALLAASTRTVLEPDLNKRSGRGGSSTLTATAALRTGSARTTSTTETGRQSGVLHAYSGNALLQKKKFAEAEIELKKATAEEPEDAEWQALLGYSLFQQKKYTEASQALKTAVRLAPENDSYKEILKESERREKQ